MNQRALSRVANRLARDLDLVRTWWESRFLSRMPSSASGKPLLIVTMSNRSVAGKTWGLLGRRIELEGFRPVVLTSAHAPNALRVMRMFGLSEFELIDPSTVRPRPDVVPEPSHRMNERFLLDFRYRGVNIGRAVLNSVTRENLLGKLDFSQPAVRDRVRQLLARSAGFVDHAEQTIRRIGPALALFQGDRGYSPVGELFGVCLREQIPAIPVFPSQRGDAWVLKRYSAANELDSPHSLSDATWAKVLAEPWPARREQELMQMLVSAYESGSWYANVYERPDRRLPERQELRAELGIGEGRKVGAIFPHILWDAAFFYGDALFPNYEDWLVETIRAAGKTPGMDWVVRLHPAYVSQRRLAKLRSFADLEQVWRRLGTPPANVHFIQPHEDLSALALMRLADVCVTVQGTVGIEAPCHGVPCLTAGTGRYSGRGFTVDSASSEEYLRRIATAHLIEPLGPTTVERARRFAHTLFFRRLWSFQSFTVSRRDLRRLGSSMDRNIRLRLSTPEEFRVAPDLRRVAEWVARSDAEDYLEDSSSSEG